MSVALNDSSSEPENDVRAENPLVIVITCPEMAQLSPESMLDILVQVVEVGRLISEGNVTYISASCSIEFGGNKLNV